MCKLELYVNVDTERNLYLFGLPSVVSVRCTLTLKVVSVSGKPTLRYFCSSECPAAILKTWVREVTTWKLTTIPAQTDNY